MEELYQALKSMLMETPLRLSEMAVYMEAIDILRMLELHGVTEPVGPSYRLLSSRVTAVITAAGSQVMDDDKWVLDTLVAVIQRHEGQSPS